MKHEHIKKLLEKYLEGETSVQEERYLKAYFSGHEVPEEWESWRSHFDWVSSEKQRKRPIAEQKTAKTIRFWKWTAIAAAIALVLVSIVFFRLPEAEKHFANEEPTLQTDTFDDPEAARREIEAALALVSRKMRKGEDEAKKGLMKTKRVNGLFKPLQ